MNSVTLDIQTSSGVCITLQYNGYFSNIQMTNLIKQYWEDFLKSGYTDDTQFESYVTERHAGFSSSKINIVTLYLN